MEFHHQCTWVWVLSLQTALPVLFQFTLGYELYLPQCCTSYFLLVLLKEDCKSNTFLCNLMYLPFCVCN
uniref:Uncharacterized protein n=1 Tax=Anguilla anguilla TaxID=7936 RepID=A0A0E9XE09_ANGAN